MTRFLVALALSTALTAPAFADGMAKDMACSAFSAMDKDHMMAAMHDAMADDTSSGAMAADTTAATGGAMATDSAMMSSEDQMAARVKTCADHPDRMMMAAMHPKK